MSIFPNSQHYSKAKITAIGTYTPEKRLTNKDFEKIVETTDEWIVQRTGIRERRISESDQFTSDLCVCAVNDMVKNFQVDLQEVDFIIVATSTPDTPIPSVSSQLQNRLNLSTNIGAIDISAACAGFVQGLHLANALITSKMYKKVLVIGAETLSKVTDYSDRTTCILFGDGAGVVLVEYDERNPSFLSHSSSTEGKAGIHLYCSGLSHQLNGSELIKSQKIIQNGREIFKMAVSTLVNEIPKLMEQSEYQLSDVNWFVPHSANLRIIEAICQRLDFPVEKVLFSSEYFGNTSSATIPLALKIGMEQGKLKKDDLVLLSGFGGGFVHSSTLIRWSL